VDFVDGVSIDRREDLTLAQYQAEAAMTIQPDAPYVYFAVKLMCESSEVAQPLINQFFHEKPASIEHLVEELGDLLWYIAGLAGSFDLSLDVIAAANIAKLRARHGVNYNADYYRQRARVDGLLDGLQGK
jgi:NTP pyrophosphatase (non-canonical NTP hydrolase)